MAAMTQTNPLDGHAKYKTVEFLGSGSFGFVVKAKNKYVISSLNPPCHGFQRETGKIVAIKFIQRGKVIKRFVLREILNHRSLRHPHVIQFQEVFVTNTHLAIVMEYADKGDLFSHVRVRLPSVQSSMVPRTECDTVG